MRYILALDQGTTSSRAILFDHAGNVAGLAQKEFPQLYPKPGWVEHNPLDIWETQSSVALEALTRAGVTPADVAALGRGDVAEFKRLRAFLQSKLGHLRR